MQVLIVEDRLGLAEGGGGVGVQNGCCAVRCEEGGGRGFTTGQDHDTCPTLSNYQNHLSSEN